MTRQLTARITRLEARQGGRPRDCIRDADWTDGQWLGLFEELGHQGFFDEEPDFPRAVASLRQAVDTKAPRPIELEWLIEMYLRVRGGKPAATEAEFTALADWYMRNEVNVYNVSIRSMLMSGPRRLGATETFETLRSLRSTNPALH
jgi:hypothetical protein